MKKSKPTPPLLPIAALLAALAGACGNENHLPPPPSVITFELRNDGGDAVYLYQDCLLSFTITQLGDPTRQIARQGACPCDCAVATCPVCGPCFQGAREVGAGGFVMEPWRAVNVTYEPRPTGTCERQHTLPAGSYRIDIPVYSVPPTPQAIEEGTAVPRTATQTFTLPAPYDTVTVPVGASP